MGDVCTVRLFVGGLGASLFVEGEEFLECFYPSKWFMVLEKAPQISTFDPI
jgi:hypothetical protein